jgi:outer membrane protein OmpA-like peptidoglycan-associated protein
MPAYRGFVLLLILSTCVASLAARVQETRPSPALTPAQIAKALEETGSIVLRGVLFDSGKSSLKRESLPELAVVGEVLKNDPALRLEIQAYTDNVGSRPVNFEIARARASAVREHLMKTYGISADRLVATGLGDANPIADNSTARGRAQNRRIELVKLSTTAVRTPPAQSSTASEWTGRITTGMMAIGGESTGITLSNGRESFELQPANDAIRQQLQNLNGSTATVRGRLDVRQGVEIRERRIVTVTEVIAR